MRIGVRGAGNGINKSVNSNNNRYTIPYGIRTCRPLVSNNMQMPLEEPPAKHKVDMALASKVAVGSLVPGARTATSGTTTPTESYVNCIRQVRKGHPQKTPARHNTEERPKDGAM